MVLFLQILFFKIVRVNYKISISIWKILNILANAIFISLSETMKGLIVHLLLFADAFLCKLGVWGPLGAREVVTVYNLKICIFLLQYPE